MDDGRGEARGGATGWVVALLIGQLAGCGGHAPMAAEAWQPYQPVVQGGGQGWRQTEAQERSRRAATARTSGSDDRSPERDAQPVAPAPAPQATSAAPDRAESARPPRAPARRPSPKASVIGSKSGGVGASAGGGPAASVGSAAAGKVVSGSAAPSAKALGGAVAEEEPEPDLAQARRDVVFLGYLQLEVRRRVDALLAIEARVRALAGYVDRMAGNVVVVRVPAGDFEAAMATFAEVGRVLDRRVQALDVSEQVSDLDSRLRVLRGARERLLLLLARAQSVQERLSLMEQIKRLSGQIEEIEASLQTLRDLVAWQTITLELVAKEGDAAIARRSAFPWVRALGPGRPGPGGSADDLTVGAIAGFVALRDADPYTARAADSSGLQVFSVVNEPQGDAAFWHKAIAWELEGRGDKRLDEGSAGGFRWQLWQSREPRPWSWLLAVRVVGDRVVVVAAFLPDLAALERHKAAVLGALLKVEVKP